MKLSPQEKLILVMLCDIQKKLGIDGEVNHEFIAKSIFSDNTWAIPWELPGIFGDEQFDDPPEVEAVSDILEMWSQIEASYSSLTAPEKSRVETEAAPFGREVKFPGFDGNRESTHLGIARHFIKEMGRWTEFSGRDLNSHAPSLAAYQRMLEVFNRIRESNTTDLLSVGEVVEILKARKHPKG
jgi:uncharacterized protein YfbU (UPF0304 family)